jgi:hypothetical protein
MKLKWYWILPILWNASGWATPTVGRCGMTGTVEQRMKDCGDTSMKRVMVDPSGKKVIKRDDTGLLWGDPLEGTYSLTKAKEACENATAAQGYPSIPGLKEKWRLPTAEEFARIGGKDQKFFNKLRTKLPESNDIEGNGMWMDLFNWDYFFMTSSTVVRGSHVDVWGFYGYDGFVGIIHAPDAEGGDYPGIHGSGRVRCVAR